MFHNVDLSYYTVNSMRAGSMLVLFSTVSSASRLELGTCKRFLLQNKSKRELTFLVVFFFANFFPFSGPYHFFLVT